MAVEKDLAIVIRSFPLRESDRIITFCTPSFGKVRAVARGSRKATSRLAASLELFNFGELVFFQRPNRDLQYVNTFDVSAPYGTELQDPMGLAYASYFAELIGELSLENDRNPSLFELLREGLDAVLRADTVRDLQHIARGFEMRLLIVSGYRPHLKNCVSCGGALPSREVAVSVALGGALCGQHADLDRTLRLGATTLRVGREIGRIPVREARTLALSRREMIELKRLLALFLVRRIDRKPRCAEYIDELEKSLADDAAIRH